MNLTANLFFNSRYFVPKLQLYVCVGAKEEKWTDAENQAPISGFAEEDVKKCESMGEKPTSRTLRMMLLTHPLFSVSPALLKT